MRGAYFVWVLIKHDVVVVIKMGPYIHGCLFCVGVYYPNFTVTVSRCGVNLQGINMHFCGFYHCHSQATANFFIVCSTVSGQCSTSMFCDIWLIPQASLKFHSLFYA